jgi:hypothetical protein
MKASSQQEKCIKLAGPLQSSNLKACPIVLRYSCWELLLPGVAFEAGRHFVVTQ